jgi:hypothetical protein
MHLSRLSAFIIAAGLLALSAVPSAAQEKKPVSAEVIKIEAKGDERDPVPPNKKDVEAILKRLQAALHCCWRAYPPLDNGVAYMYDGAYMVLLGNTSVRKVLKLTDEQNDKLNNVHAKLTEKLEKLVAEFDMNKLQERNPEERDKNALEIMDSMVKESNKAATDILLPDQAKRFQQIEWQDSGLIVFKNADIQTALKLGKDQKNKIDMILEEYFKQVQQVYSPPKLSLTLEGLPKFKVIQNSGVSNMHERGRERNGKLEELLKAAEKNLHGVLTEDQKTAFKALLGPPFKIVR